MKDGNSVLGGILLGAIVIFLLWKSANICQNIEQMKDWTAYDAKLLTARLDIKKDSDDPNTYRAIVSYQYYVAGKSYNGDRIAFGYFHSNMDRHFQVADKLKYAKIIRIWVNPEDPTESAIAQGWSETALFFIIFTSVWLFGFCGFVFWEFRSKSRLMRALGQVFLALTISAFITLFGRLIAAKYKEGVQIKLEEKIEVLDYMTEREIKRAKLLEKARKEAFRRAGTGQDTIRIRLDKDTFYVK